ncbi:MAG: GumC family protein [Hyphomicrobiaceae bacterium]
MRATTPDPHSDIDISALPLVLRRRARTLALAAAAIGLLTYGVLLLVPSRYSSEAQIRIGAPSLSDGTRSTTNAETIALSVDREAIASRVQELRSPDLAKKLAAELNLASRPEFNSAIEAGGLLNGLMRSLGFAGPRAGESEEERVLAAYYRALQVYQVKDTRVITLGFTAHDGDLSARAANRLIELYQAWLRERGATETSDAAAWLVPEIEKRTRELSTAEAAVERFRTTANLYRSGGSQVTELADQQLVDLASELTKVRTQRSEAEARAQAARELMRRGVPDAIPDVQKSPVIQGLIAQRVRAERDLAEAGSQLLPAHPRMKQLAANAADVRRQIQREASAVVDGLEREVKALALREELQKRSLAEAKAGLGSKADDRVRLAQLQDEVNAKRRELEGLRQRYEASRSHGTSMAVPIEVQVIATARPSSRPSWPNRLQIASLAAAATFVLGLVAVLFRELLSAGTPRMASGIRRREAVAMAEPAAIDAEAYNVGAVPMPVPLETPTISSAASEAVTQSQPAHITLSSIGAVAERLIANAPSHSGYRTLIVGDADASDVHEKATALANALAAVGRQVVLVDWSLDGVGLSRRLGVVASPGFVDLLTGNASFEDVIRLLPDSPIHIIPCGSACPEGVETLDPDRMNLLLDALDEAYADVVITGTHTAAREFFRAIEGRVDAGVLVRSTDGAQSPTDGHGLRFLGFDVTEIDVIHLDEARPVSAIRALGRRVRRADGLPQAASTAT